MKISLIHPSRSRPEKAKTTYDYWMSKISGKHEIEHILSLDFSDPMNELYGVIKITNNGIIEDKHVGFGDNSKTIIDHNDSVVEATNEAAKVSTGDVLTYMSDDFFPPENWDIIIERELSLDLPMLIKVDDGLQKFNVTVLTIPIMNRKLYEKLGYMWHPEYKSMHVDVDLFITLEKNKLIKNCPEILFQHKHHSVGLAENDETYKRSETNWNQGLEILKKRELLGFPI